MTFDVAGVRAFRPNNGMKRRTFRQIRAAAPAAMHHSVYVVLLDAKAGKLRSVRALNPNAIPGKPCMYVGLTGLDSVIWLRENPIE